NADVVAELRRHRVHRSHPAVELPPALEVTDDLVAACDRAEAVVMACPSHAMRAVAGSMMQHVARSALVVSTAQGIETDSRLTISAVLEDVLEKAMAGRVAGLSGPSFA